MVLSSTVLSYLPTTAWHDDALTHLLQNLMGLGAYKCKGPYGADFGAKTLGKCTASFLFSTAPQYYRDLGIITPCVSYKLS
mgnify:CR=1 FL=1